MKFTKDFTYRNAMVTIHYSKGDTVPQSDDIRNSAKEAGALDKEKKDDDGTPDTGATWNLGDFEK